MNKLSFAVFFLAFFINFIDFIVINAVFDYRKYHKQLVPTNLINRMIRLKSRNRVVTKADINYSDSGSFVVDKQSDQLFDKYDKNLTYKKTELNYRKIETKECFVNCKLQKVDDKFLNIYTDSQNDILIRSDSNQKHINYRIPVRKNRIDTNTDQKRYVSKNQKGKTIKHIFNKTTIDMNSKSTIDKNREYGYNIKKDKITRHIFNKSIVDTNSIYSSTSTWI